METNYEELPETISKEELIKILKLKDMKLEEKSNLSEVLTSKLETIEKKIKKDSENRLHLSEALKGIPQLNFMKVNQSKTASKSNNPKQHESKHEEIKVIEKLKIKTYKKNIDFDTIPNPYLTIFDDYQIGKFKRVQYASEDTIKSLSNLLFKDILKMMALSHYLSICETISIRTTMDDENNVLNIPDLIIIKTRHNFPILVIEVKSPSQGKENILENKKVLGQIYDYMLSLKSFYNTKEVYGILTTLKEWRFLKLPEDEDLDVSERKIMATKIYDLSDKKLIKIIMSVIDKSLSAKHYPIQVFDIKRSYLEYREDKWRWKIFEENELNSLTNKINFNVMKSYKINNYKAQETSQINLSGISGVVLKFFDDGKETQSSLCISNHGSLCVIKQYFGDNLENFKQEAKMWNKIYDIDVKISTLCGVSSIVMPLVFTAHHRDRFFIKDEVEYSEKEVYFQLDFRKIFTTHGAIHPHELSRELISLQREIEDGYYNLNKINPYNAAMIAIKEFSEKGYYHDDFEWRHLGLIPVLNKKGEFKKLKPILIDLEYVVKESPKKSEKIMIEKLKCISNNCVYVNDENIY